MVSSANFTEKAAARNRRNNVVSVPQRLGFFCACHLHGNLHTSDFLYIIHLDRWYGPVCGGSHNTTNKKLSATDFKLDG